MKHVDSSRRHFLGAAALALTGAALAPAPTFGAPALLKRLGKPDSKFNGVQIGVITYSFRSLPVDAERVLRYCLTGNVSAIELMGNTAEAFAGAPHAVTEPMAPRGGTPGPRPEPTPAQQAERAARAKDLADWRARVPMDKFEQLRKMYKSAGVTIYAYKPNAFGAGNTDAEVDYGMRAARALGASHVTLEMPTDPARTGRLAAIAARYKMQVAYHGHEQQTPTLWDAALAESKYNALNCDLGHYTAAGHDALALIAARHDRIASVHLKDRQNPAHGKGNLPWGTGDTPIAEVLRLMRKNKYDFPGTVELEYQVPEGSDAVGEVAKCVEFCRRALEKTS